MKKTVVIFAALALAAAAVSAGQNNGARAALVIPGAGDGAGEMMKNDYLVVRVDVSNMEAANAVHFDLQYDTEGLEYVDWMEGDLYSDPLTLGPIERLARGVLDVTVATMNGPRRVSEATAGTVRFRVLDPRRTGVAISALQTADSDWEVDTQIDLGRGLGAAPAGVHLIGNVPNPFNPTTSIRYELPQATRVSLKVIDVSGRVVKALVSGSESAGAKEVRWNGENDNGQSVSSGVYFMYLEAGGETRMMKMTLIR